MFQHGKGTHREILEGMVRLMKVPALTLLRSQVFVYFGPDAEVPKHFDHHVHHLQLCGVQIDIHLHIILLLIHPLQMYGLILIHISNLV